jgi:hypothetical protein
MWCIIITMTTVGFGDYFPSTHLGRSVGVLACLWGTFLLSLMTVALTNTIQFTHTQAKVNNFFFFLPKQAFEAIRDDECHSKLNNLTMNVLKSFFKYILFVKKNKYQIYEPKVKRRRYILLNNLRKRIGQFKHLRR